MNTNQSEAEALKRSINKLYDCILALDTAKQDIDNAAQAVITADEAVAGAFEILCSLREAELDKEPYR